MKEKYDYVISRAVGKLDNIFKLSIPFLTKTCLDETTESLSTGAVIVIKGGDISEEIKSIKNKKEQISFSVIDINFKGSDTLFNPDKKIVIMYDQK